MKPIVKLKDKYFKNQYVNLISGPEDYHKEMDEYGNWCYNQKRDTYDLPYSPENGKDYSLNFKLTTLAYDLKNRRMTQYFTDYSLFSLCHEMGHWVSVSFENCMKPSMGLPFVSPDADSEWIENFAIPMEMAAFAFESVLTPIYDPEYKIENRFITFNSVLNLNKYFKTKYGSNHLINELHPEIEKRFNQIRDGISIESFNELWFIRNDYFLNNPILCKKDVDI